MMPQSIYLVKQQKRSNKINIISQREFWEKKVETFIQMFLYGRDTPQQFIKNMLLMGFQEEEVSDFLEECLNEILAVYRQMAAVA